MLEAAGHACQMCGTTEPGKKGFHLDHCHDTMKPRGVLCSKCNTTLGHLGDTCASIDLVAAMAKSYLCEEADDE